jgi:hypothetical protein
MDDGEVILGDDLVRDALLCQVAGDDAHAVVTAHLVRDRSGQRLRHVEERELLEWDGLVEERAPHPRGPEKVLRRLQPQEAQTTGDDQRHLRRADETNSHDVRVPHRVTEEVCTYFFRSMLFRPG